MIQEIEIAEVATRLAGDVRPILIDVREIDEHAAGFITGALLIPQDLLAARIDAAAPDKRVQIIVYCASGVRSALAARTLADLGYGDVRSMRGGFIAWQRAGQAWIIPPTDGATASLNADQLSRYSRHLRLPEVGVEGQRRLLDARVLCVGAGGLGSPASLYLAAAGIGTLGIIDDDVVDLSNLQRQIVHGSDRVGMAKVDSAQQTLAGLNPDVSVVKIRARLCPENALAVLADYDVIVDGSDNFATRYLINDVALRLGMPVVHASIYRFEGQLTVFSAAGAPCYRCLFPKPPPADASPSCQDAGVLGMLPGVMGVLQATEAIKLVLGIGDSLAGRLVLYDALSMRFSEFQLSRDLNCPACGVGVDRAEIPLVDYAAFCSGK